LETISKFDRLKNWVLDCSAHDKNLSRVVRLKTCPQGALEILILIFIHFFKYEKIKTNAHTFLTFIILGIATVSRTTTCSLLRVIQKVTYTKYYKNSNARIFFVLIANTANGARFSF
jgi:hypothetical protein